MSFLFKMSQFKIREEEKDRKRIRQVETVRHIQTEREMINGQVRDRMKQNDGQTDRQPSVQYIVYYKDFMILGKCCSISLNNITPLAKVSIKRFASINK